jgi:L-aspartate oxidase
VACTGVHGANRLASNSLLEGLVFGLRLAAGLAEPARVQHLPEGRLAQEVPVYDAPEDDEDLLRMQPDEQSTGLLRRQVRQIMWQYVSLRRDQEGLLEARRQLHALRQGVLRGATPGTDELPARVAWRETVNMFKAAELVIAAALQRRESRGSHWRGDYQQSDERLARTHYVFRPMQMQRSELHRLQEVAPHG